MTRGVPNKSNKKGAAKTTNIYIGLFTEVSVANMKTEIGWHTNNLTNKIKANMLYIDLVNNSMLTDMV